MFLLGKCWAKCLNACNVLSMFPLKSRYPRPQWQRVRRCLRPQKAWDGLSRRRRNRRERASRRRRGLQLWLRRRESPKSEYAVFPQPICTYGACRGRVAAAWMKKHSKTRAEFNKHWLTIPKDERVVRPWYRPILSTSRCFRYSRTKHKPRRMPQKEYVLIISSVAFGIRAISHFPRLRTSIPRSQEARKRRGTQREASLIVVLAVYSLHFDQRRLALPVIDRYRP
jgi:hypothetical protein